MTQTGTDLHTDWTEAVRQGCLVDVARLPPPVRLRLGQIIADTIGVSVAGHNNQQMLSLLGSDDVLGAMPLRETVGATVLSPVPGRACAELAARLNATAGSFLELDEGMRPTGHPGMQVVMAALAVAQTMHSTGPELERAVAAGYEVTARLFQGYRLRYPVHPHGHFGGVGAAVAAALLTHTDPVECAAVASTTPLLSTWPPCFEGATARNTWMGLAAETGVRSTRLVRAGFTGSRESLGAAFGEVAGELVDRAVLVAPLDHTQLGLMRNYFKMHSACALTHAAIDAVLAVEVPSSDEITRIRVETVQNNMKLDRQPRANSLSARFSLPYAVAAAVMHRQSDAAAFEYDDAVAALAGRVEVSVAPDLESQWPAASPARVVIETAGSEVRSEVANPRGFHSDPLTEAELAAKFDANVGANAPALWGRLTNLADESDCATLFDGWR